MGSTSRARRRRWIRRQFDRIRQNRRNRCLPCHYLKNLQLAHRRSTGLDGQGRGSYERLRDVRQHPRAYALMCLACHRLYDALILRAPSQHRGWRCDLVPRDHALSVLRSASQFTLGDEIGLRGTDDLQEGAEWSMVVAERIGGDGG